MAKVIRQGLVARKRGMTQVFRDDGTAVAVTVLEAGPCTVVQVKAPATDGYSALQLGFEPCGVIRHAGFKFGRWLDLELFQFLLDTPAEPRDGGST